MTDRPGRLVLLGHPLGHSLSPTFQNAALRAAGIPLTYEPLDVPRSALRRTLHDLHIARAAGNVTIPYKEEVAGSCERLSAAARAVGAVNTFWSAVDGVRVGDNTDVDGFRAAVARLLGDPPEDAHVALLGAGGAASAVLHALEAWQRPQVRVYSRTRERAERLVRRFTLSATVVASAEDAVVGASVVVNATPIGRRADDPVPFPLTALARGAAVLDLTYGMNETALVRDARAHGHPAMDGLLMLVEQGATSFERWFNVTADRAEMWAALGRDAMMT
ncbi:MAG TPA: shikimate dehydrogenase [Gemmatimonadaceae bacterium]|nr:shikimate dehydrogenase [Gemmatimonadaceae bacterium]